MSYQQISVREAIKNANSKWFLPNTQRPYVWGSRYESEMYICRLFDSILRGYPIGTLLLWKTERKMPYREFVDNFKDEDLPNKSVEEGRWSAKDKELVYDGQQRIQTLYSCLKYTINDKILVFNLLFNMKKEVEPNETGFKFIEKKTGLSLPFVKMTEIFSKSADEKFEFRKEILNRCKILPLSEGQTNLLEKNLDDLWKVFVETDKKCLAYFPIVHDDEKMVNEIFLRINTGGVPLSRADLLLSNIKVKNFDFEEQLQDFTKKIYTATGAGYQFDEYSALQLLYLIIKGTTRVDPDNIKSQKELDKFVTVWNEVENSVTDFFVDFLFGEFKINKAEIIPKKMALYPLMTYFYHNYKKGKKFTAFGNENIVRLKKYFILSQINDWNIQSIIDEFNRTIEKNAENSFDFPLDELVKSAGAKRKTKLLESDFMDYRWFSLKILTPHRVYQFDPEITGRLNPQIDHIFPKKLATEESQSIVNTIWNMQPIKGDINNFKRKKHPKDFFSSEEGKKYLVQYDYLPTGRRDDPLWDNTIEFIIKRKELMIFALKEKYGLEFDREEQLPQSNNTTKVNPKR